MVTGTKYAAEENEDQLKIHGALGKLKQVKVGLPGPNWVSRAKGPVPDSPPPPALDILAQQIVAACVAENNSPVVGKQEQIRAGKRWKSRPSR